MRINISYSLRSYLAVNTSSSFPKPEIVGEVANQNLHAMPFVDMVIITHPSFLQQAKRLADAHNKRHLIIGKF